jgi:multidrug efflux pump subunit AcrB
MSGETQGTTEVEGGAIAWMARNSVAANLLMMVILVAGLLGLSRVKQEVFPEFDLDLVNITVVYPGASPADVEQGIILAVEEAVRGVDGVKRVSSQARENGGVVAVELLLNADPDKVLQDVKNEVDRISTFPEEAEEPIVALATRRTTVVNLMIAGDADLGTLHAIAEKARSELLATGQVTQITLSGVPPLEVAIEVPRERLEAHGLTLGEIARQITASSLELPGGGVDTERGEILVRLSDRRLRGSDFADLVVRGSSTGAELRLGEIARITDGYQDTDQETYYNGQRAVQLTAYRVGAETPKSVARAVRDYTDRLRGELPSNVVVAIWDDDSELLADRIDLLVRNARMGLLLVVVILAMFLDLRLAFWVSLGIPISFMGAFMLMPVFGASINMVSLFALIVTLGMVVDDAIIVGEDAFERMESGEERMSAAIAGARRMAVPVTFAILTTLAAFSPLFVVPGTTGKIFAVMPLVVCTVLVFSLLESFFILPAHLGHGGHGEPGLLGRSFNRLNADVRRFVQQPVTRLLTLFSDRMYRPSLRLALRLRYATVAAGFAAFVMAVAVVASGVLPFAFFPALEGNVVKVSARLPYGAPIERTTEVEKAIEGAMWEALGDFGGEAVLEGMLAKVGEGPGSRSGPGEQGSHLVVVEVELVKPEERDFGSAEFMKAWEAAMPPVTGVESLVFTAAVGPGAGAAVAVQLSHPDNDVLGAASAEVTEALRGFKEVSSVENGFQSGKTQLDFKLLPKAANLGLTSGEVARQVRDAFFGAEAVREQRGRNELKVMVRVPETQRISESDVENMRVRTPAGGWVPLTEVVEVHRGRSPTTILREDGRRNVVIKGDRAPGVMSTRPVLEALSSTVFPALQEKYPGLDVDFVGEQREQGEAFAVLRTNFFVALFLIYALLAIPSRSYLNPIAVMGAIPLGFVGAVLGHLLMGFELSVISVMGIIALSGVVVNDSLVLVDAAEEARGNGMSAFDAVIYGGTRRLRPILLTSLTTFFGLAPMVFETSVQARFLVPMAISLGYGVMFATVVTLVVVPAGYLILEDIRNLPGWLASLVAGEREAAPAAPEAQAPAGS